MHAALGIEILHIFDLVCLAEDLLVLAKRRKIVPFHGLVAAGERKNKLYMGESLSEGENALGSIRIKAHGTASPMNDNGEAAGMRRLFTTLPPFFSLKSYIGHTLGSCGAMETALMIGCIEQGYLPISAGFTTADAELGVSPLTVSQPAPAGYYMLNFFGFGGNNCSLILHSGSSS